MSAPRIGRLRAVLLLAAFGLSLAGQALAATIVAEQVSSTASKPTMMIMIMVDDSGGVTRCPDCDQANNVGMVPDCAAAFCWGVVAIPAQAVRAEPARTVVFAALPDIVLHEIAIRPEPHPPRSPFSI